MQRAGKMADEHPINFTFRCNRLRRCPGRNAIVKVALGEFDQPAQFAWLISGITTGLFDIVGLCRLQTSRIDADKIDFQIGPALLPARIMQILHQV